MLWYHLRWKFSSSSSLLLWVQIAFYHIPLYTNKRQQGRLKVKEIPFTNYFLVNPNLCLLPELFVASLTQLLCPPHPTNKTIRWAFSASTHSSSGKNMGHGKKTNLSLGHSKPEFSQFKFNVWEKFLIQSALWYHHIMNSSNSHYLHLVSILLYHIKSSYHDKVQYSCMDLLIRVSSKSIE